MLGDDRPRPHAVDRLVDTSSVDRHRLADGASWASIRLRSSRSSTIRAEPVGFAHDPLGERLRVTAGSSLGGQRLGQQPERADRRLQLVAHVGDEVAAHALDAGALRDVVRRTPTAPSDRSLVGERHARQVQHLRAADRRAAARVRTRSP